MTSVHEALDWWWWVYYTGAADMTSHETNLQQIQRDTGF